MARALLLKRSSPFAYPGGLPGFDPSHPCGGQTRFSGISVGANFVDLLTGKAGVATTISGAVKAIGPTSVFGVTSNIQFSGKPTGVQTGYTMAVIFLMTAAPGGTVFFFASSNGSAGANLQSNVGAAIIAGISGGSGFTSTITLSVGVPYFVAASLLPGTSPNSRGNVVLVNLATGQIQAQSTTATITTPITDTGTCTVGNRGAGASIASTHAAAMYSTQYTALPQLLAWAQDPWSFWYPRTLDLSMMLTAPAVGGSFIPAWAMNSNLPVLGTGTY